MPIRPPESQDVPSSFDPAQEDPPIRFGVFGDSNVGPGVLGCSGQAGGDGVLRSGAGVLGLNIATQGVGVRGVCRLGTGVSGKGGGSGAGVEGEAGAGPGVSGTSALGVGVTGLSNGAEAGVSGTSAQGVGVSGTGGANGAGVAGTGVNAPGVFGESEKGAGVAGTGHQGAGVLGQGRGSGPAVLGEAGDGPGVKGVSSRNTGVQGVAEAGDGVSGTSTGGTGVSGSSAIGTGVSGASTQGIGVEGRGGPTQAGVVGTSDETTPDAEGATGIGTGVLGSVEVGTGVAGTSVEGQGVSGFSVDGPGVSGTSRTRVGVWGESGDDGFELSLGIPFGAIGVAAVGDVGLVASGVTRAADFMGDVNVSGSINKSACSFRIDHPLDPAHRVLSHCSVESSERKNVYDGTVTLDAQGRATVELPDWFEALNEDFRYQLTALGAPAPELHVSREVGDHSFAVAGGGPGQRVSWQVTGVRADAWARGHPLVTEEEKPPAEQGYFLHPGEHGEPPERGIVAARRQVPLRQVSWR
ncbi:hypothetical protein ACIGZJ_14950 [Kitasatospora sp. NPDC052868]|uniref:hypothetical protein n=1 Tax=Kitasatospora sp. NPDC052868 TaxID=3364060 RepID=UPI0037C8E467